MGGERYGHREEETSRWDRINRFFRGSAHDVLLGGMVLSGGLGFALVSVVQSIGPVGI